MGHNEPVEHAQKSTGIVTAAEVLKVIREGSSVSLHGAAAYDRASYSDSFVFDLVARHEDYKTKVERSAEIRVPGYVTNGHTSERAEQPSSDPYFQPYMRYTEGFRPTSGFFYMGCARDTLCDILEVLPKDAEISFHVYLDAGTTEGLVRADITSGRYQEKGFHSDHLYLEATYKIRGKSRTRRYLVSVATGPHNSARFGGPR